MEGFNFTIIKKQIDFYKISKKLKKNIWKDLLKLRFFYKNYNIKYKINIIYDKINEYEKIINYKINYENKNKLKIINDLIVKYINFDSKIFNIKKDCKKLKYYFNNYIYIFVKFLIEIDFILFKWKFFNNFKLILKKINDMFNIIKWSNNSLIVKLKILINKYFNNIFIISNNLNLYHINKKLEKKYILTIKKFYNKKFLSILIKDLFLKHFIELIRLIFFSLENKNYSLIYFNIISIEIILNTFHLIKYKDLIEFYYELWKIINLNELKINFEKIYIILNLFKEKYFWSGEFLYLNKTSEFNPLEIKELNLNNLKLKIENYNLIFKKIKVKNKFNLRKNIKKNLIRKKKFKINKNTINETYINDNNKKHKQNNSLNIDNNFDNKFNKNYSVDFKNNNLLNQHFTNVINKSLNKTFKDIDSINNKTKSVISSETNNNLKLKFHKKNFRICSKDKIKFDYGIDYQNFTFDYEIQNIKTLISNIKEKKRLLSLNKNKRRKNIFKNRFDFKYSKLNELINKFEDNRFKNKTKKDPIDYNSFQRFIFNNNHLSMTLK